MRIKNGKKGAMGFLFVFCLRLTADMIHGGGTSVTKYLYFCFNFIVYWHFYIGIVTLDELPEFVN